MAQSHTESGIELLALERQMQRINYKHKPRCVQSGLSYGTSSKMVLQKLPVAVDADFDHLSL